MFLRESSRSTTFTDFFALWSSARYVLEHGLDGLYGDALEAFQNHLAGVAKRGYHPFSYPPVFLLVVLPFGLLPYLLGYALAMGLSLGGMIVGALGRRAGALSIIALLTCPAALISLMYGQNGFLSAALLCGGIRLLQSARPVWGGVLLGTLCYKPQLALLVPVALVAAREWRALAAAAASAATVSGASLLAFGVAAWADWLGFMSRFSPSVLTALDRLPKMSSLTPALLRLGVSSDTALALQGLLSVLAIILVWVVWRRSSERAAAAAVLIGASFLVTPYAFFYDLPPLAVAVVWLCIEIARRGDADNLERLVLALAWVLPLLNLFSDKLAIPPLAPVAPLVLSAFTVLAARRALASASRRSAPLGTGLAT